MLEVVGDRPRTYTDAVMAATRGIARGWHLGFQLYVSVNGRTVIDVAGGTRTGGDSPTPMTTTSVMPWFSAGKPLLAVCIGQLHDRGLLDLDDRVMTHVPEFTGGQRDDVTIAHLLTHTAGLVDEVTAFEASRAWPEVLAVACRTRMATNAQPGRHAHYSAFAASHLLAEIVRRRSRSSFEDYVRESVFEPAGMEDCHFGVSNEDLARVRDRRVAIYDTTGPHPFPVPFINTSTFWRTTVPGMGARGPIRSLGRFYEALLDPGAGLAALSLSPATAARLTTTHRSGLFDPFYRGAVDWGLGFATDPRLFGGPRSSPRVFGHDGRRLALAFADPEHGLVFCGAASGMPSLPDNRRRFRLVVDAVLDVLEVRPRQANRAR